MVKYIKSVSAGPAAAGALRLANADKMNFRNYANTSDLEFGVSTSDRLQFGGVNIPTISSTDTLTNKTLTSPALTTPTISSGDTTFSSLTASTVPYLNASKVLTSSAVTDTELGYLSGATSNIQSQLGNKVTGPGSATDNRVVRMDGTSGRLVQESTIAIDDSGNMTGVGSVDFVGTLTGSALTASRALVTNGSKGIASSSVTSTELGYLAGVTAPTGSGALVLGTSPSLTTPNIGTPSAGTLTNCTGLPSSSITTKTDGVAVAAGKIGEKLTGSFLTPTFTTDTATNIMSLVLTAGVWQIYGSGQTGTAGSTYTRFVVSLSTTSATHNFKSSAVDNYGSNDKDREVTPAPIYVNTTGTTVYLVGTCTFTGAAPVSTSGYNELYAIRVG